MREKASGYFGRRRGKKGIAARRRLELELEGNARGRVPRLERRDWIPSSSIRSFNRTFDSSVPTPIPGSLEDLKSLEGDKVSSCSDGRWNNVEMKLTALLKRFDGSGRETQSSVLRFNSVAVGCGTVSGEDEMNVKTVSAVAMTGSRLTAERDYSEI